MDRVSHVTSDLVRFLAHILPVFHMCLLLKVLDDYPGHSCLKLL